MRQKWDWNEWFLRMIVERGRNEIGMSVFLGGNHPTFARPPPPFRPRSEVVPIPPLFPERCRTITERGTRFEWQERKLERLVVADRSTLVRDRSGHFPQHWWSFRHRSVVPSNEDHSSFDLVPRLNDYGTRVISVCDSFHLKNFLTPRALKRHRNDDEITWEWCRNDIGMANSDNNGTTAQWCENGYESSLGSVNRDIYFHCDFVPSNEDHSSFHLVLKLNDNGTRQFPFLRRSILELFSCLVHWNDTGTMMKWHWNDVGMRLEWRIEIFNGMTAQWCENDFESSLGSVNWSIYFH